MDHIEDAFQGLVLAASQGQVDTVAAILRAHASSALAHPGEEEQRHGANAKHRRGRDSHVHLYNDNNLEWQTILNEAYAVACAAGEPKPAILRLLFHAGAAPPEATTGRSKERAVTTTIAKAPSQHGPLPGHHQVKYNWPLAAVHAEKASVKERVGDGAWRVGSS